MTEYDTLVLSGGAIKGLCILGALHCCDNRGLLKNIKTYIGTSIGSVICFLICIGYSPLEVIIYICVRGILKRKWMLDIFQMMNGKGALQYGDFNEILEQMIIHKIGILPTLGAIKKIFDREIIISTYNYTQRRKEYISSSSHPDIPCLTAIRMSCNIPLLFSRYFYTDCEFIDGCVVERFPISAAANQSKVLGITLTPETYDSNNIMSYLLDIMMLPAREIFQESTNNTNHTIVKLDCDDEGFFWNLEASTSRVMNLIYCGYKSTFEQLGGHT